MDCSNPTGAKLVTTKVYEGVLPPASPCRLQEGSVLTVMSVAGPYSTTEPLEDVLDVIVAKKPDVAILMGPFVDMKNSAVLSSSESFDKQWINRLGLIGEKVA